MTSDLGYTGWPGLSVRVLRVKYSTVVTLSIETDRHLQTVDPNQQHLIRVYTVCHTNSNILDTSSLGNTVV